MSSEHDTAPVEGTSFHLEPRQQLEILFAILLALFLFALDQTTGRWCGAAQSSQRAAPSLHV